MAPLPDLPKVCVDFNGLVAAEPLRVALDIPLTRKDLDRQGLKFEEGRRVIFYDLDETEAGDPDNLVAVGVMALDDCWGWIGVIDGYLSHESEWRAVD